MQGEKSTAGQSKVSTSCHLPKDRIGCKCGQEMEEQAHHMKVIRNQTAHATHNPVRKHLEWPVIVARAPLLRVLEAPDIGRDQAQPGFPFAQEGIAKDLIVVVIDKLVAE